MPIPFLSAVDLSGNELQNARIQNLASAPTHAVGRIYFNTATGLLGISDGTDWTYVEVGALDIEAVQDAVGAMFTGSTVVTSSYNDGAGTVALTIGTGQIVNAMVSAAAAISADKIADGTTNKVFTATEKTKLSGIATGATANAADATLLARANHTGTQPASTISDFNSAVDARVANVVAGAPAALDTLDELAQALGDDANFATTVTNSLATKAARYSVDIGNGALTSIVVTHNLNTRDVVVGIRLTGSPYTMVQVDWAATTVNTITLTFAVAPTASQYRVTVIG